MNEVLQIAVEMFCLVQYFCKHVQACASMCKMFLQAATGPIQTFVVHPRRRLLNPFPQGFQRFSKVFKGFQRFSKVFKGFLLLFLHTSALSALESETACAVARLAPLRFKSFGLKIQIKKGNMKGFLPASVDQLNISCTFPASDVFVSRLCTARSELDCKQAARLCTSHIAQCAQCTLHSVHSEHCTLHSVHSAHCTLCTLHNAPCTLHSVHGARCAMS